MWGQVLLMHLLVKFVQVELVAMGTCIAKGMGQTLQLWAQLCSTMGWAVGLAMRLSVWATPGGACLAPLWLQPPISAHQTMLFLTTMGVGATLPSTTLISLSLSSSTLPNTKLELCLWLTEGKAFVRIWSLKTLPFSKEMADLCLSVVFKWKWLSHLIVIPCFMVKVLPLFDFERVFAPFTI